MLQISKKIYPIAVLLNSNFSFAWKSRRFACFSEHLIFMHTSFVHQFKGINKFNMAAARRSETRKLRTDKNGAQFSSQFIQVVYIIYVISSSGLNYGNNSSNTLLI